MPHSRPNTIQDFVPSVSSSCNVNQKITARISAVRLVSHTQRVHQYITEGKSAHSQVVPTATFSLKHFRAIKKSRMQVSAENKLFMPRRIRAEAGVYTPAILKTVPIR